LPALLQSYHGQTALAAAPGPRVEPTRDDKAFRQPVHKMLAALYRSVCQTFSREPLADGSFGNVRRIQEENFGNRLIACDLANPDFVRFGESFGAAAERARTPKDLRKALRRGFARADVPTVIEVPVGPFPSPWEFIHMPRVRGG
jgi:hypothetical protein